RRIASSTVLHSHSPTSRRGTIRPASYRHFGQPSQAGRTRPRSPLSRQISSATRAVPSPYVVLQTTVADRVLLQINKFARANVLAAVLSRPNLKSRLTPLLSRCSRTVTEGYRAAPILG